MSKREKIRAFKRIIGIYDDNIAENYLRLTDWNQDNAVQLYLEEKSNKDTHVNNRNQNVRPNPAGKIEFKINYKLHLTQEVYKPNEQLLYKDLNTFMRERFIYVGNTFEDFFNLLKSHAGLIIVLSKEKIYELRNNLIRISNNPLCKDIIENAVIFPVMKDSATGYEFVQKFIPRDYPLYLFCKYKNNQAMEIVFRSENQIKLEYITINLLECFPDTEIKQNIYKNLNETILKIKKSYQFGNYINNVNNHLDQNIQNNVNNHLNQNDHKNQNNLLSDPKNYFYGDQDELLALISSLEINIPPHNNNINQSNNNINQSNNNINQSNNNINQSINNINQSNNKLDYNAPNPMNNNYNDSQILNDNGGQNMNNINYSNVNNVNNNQSHIQESYNNNQSYNNQIHESQLNNNHYNNNHNYNNNYNNNQNIQSQFNYNNSINQSNNTNIKNNQGFLNNIIDDKSEVQNSLNENNQSINHNNQSINPNNQNHQNIEDSIFGLSDGEIMAKREREIKELERQEEERIKKEEEEKLKNENYEKEANIYKQNLDEEPDENNPDVCKIMFRYPNGEKNSQRRFLKTDKIQKLYDYVKSLGREIYSESKMLDFELISGFPPKNLENSKNKTLLEEGLFPSSMIQIKEK